MSNLLLTRAIDSRFGEFKFIEETHKYLLGERELPGITGILTACRFIDPTWYTEESRIRGSHVHLAIKFLNKGTLDWDSVLDQYLGYVAAYEKFMRDWNLTVESFEKPMYHPDLLFAGTHDIVGTVLDNVPSIVELKTGPAPKWAALQTAAQELLVRAWEDKRVRRRRFGVTLKADGTYAKPIEFTDFERDEVTFRMLNTIVQRFGKERTKLVFDVIEALSPAEREALQLTIPTISAAIEYRELYAA